MKTKCITIRDDQEKYIQKTSLNLSRFIQNCLDKEMQKRGKSYGKKTCCTCDRKL